MNASCLPQFLQLLFCPLNFPLFLTQSATIPEVQPILLKYLFERHFRRSGQYWSNELTGDSPGTAGSPEVTSVGICSCIMFSDCYLLEAGRPGWTILVPKRWCWQQMLNCWRNFVLGESGELLCILGWEVGGGLQIRITINLLLQC